MPCITFTLHSWHFHVPTLHGSFWSQSNSLASKLFGMHQHLTKQHWHVKLMHMISMTGMYGIAALLKDRWQALSRTTHSGETGTCIYHEIAKFFDNKVLIRPCVRLHRATRIVPTYKKVEQITSLRTIILYSFKKLACLWVCAHLTLSYIPYMILLQTIKTIAVVLVRKCLFLSLFAQSHV